MNDISAWISSLRQEWIAGCSDEVLKTAYLQYQSPGRFYHTWSHIRACVEALHTFPCESGRNVFLALLFHDAIYIPGNPENEEQSAGIAARILQQHSDLGETELEKVCRLILATRDHRVEGRDDGPDLRAVLDIDMSILGESWDKYRQYADGVRNEYCPSVTTELRFVAGRIKFLSGVLASRTIFHSPEGISRWERNARENVGRELGELRSQQNFFWRTVSALLGWARH